MAWSGPRALCLKLNRGPLELAEALKTGDCCRKFLGLSPHGLLPCAWEAEEDAGRAGAEAMRCKDDGVDDGGV